MASSITSKNKTNIFSKRFNLIFFFFQEEDNHATPLLLKVGKFIQENVPNDKENESLKMHCWQFGK